MVNNENALLSGDESIIVEPLHSHRMRMNVFTSRSVPQRTIDLLGRIMEGVLFLSTTRRLLLISPDVENYCMY